MYKISLNNATKLFDAIKAAEELYLPIENAGEVEFKPYAEGAKVRLDVLQTVKSAKDAFFPQSEKLYAMKTEGKTISVINNRETIEDFVIFGVRGCDLKSFEVLDRVFLVDPVDTYYKNRREKCTIVSMACSEPDDTCFCKVFGIDATNPMGDVTTWIADGYLYWRSNTEKGEALTAKVKELLEDADTKAVEAQQKATKEIIEKLPYSNLSLDGFKGKRELDLFNSPKWAEIYKACLGCGTCTFVCPTCQCYDIREFKTNDGVQRFRCWDSCMYSDFTRMAHGNSRNSQMERFRQRFMHKLVYYPTNNEGMFSCVGCGRCLKKCPQSLNIVKVIKEVGGND